MVDLSVPKDSFTGYLTELLMPIVSNVLPYDGYLIKSNNGGSHMFILYPDLFDIDLFEIAVDILLSKFEQDISMFKDYLFISIKDGKRNQEMFDKLEQFGNYENKE